MTAALAIPAQTQRLLDAQTRSGAFPSVVTLGTQRYADENAFVTALVLDELTHLEGKAVDRAIARGLDFLESCQSRGSAGAFHFYPPNRTPPWFGADLPADADDSALALMLLAQFGRRTPAEAGEALGCALHSWQLHYRPDSVDPWVAKGACRTWLDRRAEPNPVDVCVNANVATALASLGHAGGEPCRAARDTVLRALEFVEQNPAHRIRLTPFYPDLWELVYALRRGARRGIASFADAAGRLAGTLPAHDGMKAVVCGSPDRGWLWTAPLLQTARDITRATRCS